MTVVDVGWGAGFVISALYTFLGNPESGLKGFLITAGITIWGMKLTYYITKRNIGKPE